MNTFYITSDCSGQLGVCGTDSEAVGFAQAQGKKLLGKIETDLDMLGVLRYICRR